MTFRFGVVAAAVVFCGVVLAWAVLPPKIVLLIEPRGIIVRGGHAFAWPIVKPDYLPAALIAGDSLDDPQGSRLQVYEQGRPLGPAHVPHQDIAETGSGRFSHWLSAVIFSASDNTDPRTNGRSYEAHAQIPPPQALVAVAAAVALLLAGTGLGRAARRIPRRAAFRALARAAIAAAVAVFVWAAVPPQGTWRIEPKDIAASEGRSFTWILPPSAFAPFVVVRSDSVDAAKNSMLGLFEDGKPLGPPHTFHALIADIGGGAYSHWDTAVVFSTPDGTDPRTNQRAYEAHAPIGPASWLIGIAGAILLGTLALGWRQRLRTFKSGRVARWARTAAGMLAAAVTAIPFARAASAAAIAVLVWAAFPPQGTWRIEPKDIAASGGRSFTWILPPSAFAPFVVVRSDSVDAAKNSMLRLFEDGKPLGPPHTFHALIADIGGGAYSHWDTAVVFSIPDGTDPRTNQRAYETHAPIGPPSWLIGVAGAILLGTLALGWRQRLRTFKSSRVARWARIAAGMLAASVRALPFARAAIAAAVAIFVWAAFPPQGTWRIEPKDIAAAQGRSFTWILPPSAFAPFVVVRSDSVDAAKNSSLRLFEDGKRLGPPHLVHALIADIGGGAYSHWDTALVFSTPDDTDPRTNQRAYEAHAPIGPASWLIGVAGAILLGTLTVGWRQRLRTGEPGRVPRWAYIAAGMPAAIFLAAAIMATVSLLGVFHGEREILGSELSPDRPQAFMKPAERVSPIGIYSLDFSRFVAPFLETGCCSNLEIGRGDVTILHDREFDARELDPHALRQAISLRPDNLFYDYENYLNLHLATPPRWYEVLKLRFPIRADTELIVALWLCALGAFAFHRRSVRFLTNPSPAAALRGTAAVLAALGATLLAINAAGLFVPLRHAEIDNPSPHTLDRSYGPGDATMTWEAARAQLAPGPQELRAAYAHRLTGVVAEAVIHYWHERGRRTFRLQVPIWENYVLWLAGQLRAEYRLYTFADPYKAIERGVGMCDQVSSALVTLLRREGLDARVVQLNGHTVVTAEVAAGVWHMLDADFNVVIPKSIAEIQAEPDVIRPYYQAAFNRLDPDISRIPVDLIVSYFAPPTYIGEAAANSVLGEHRIAFEALAYWLKWRLPLMLLALAALIGAVLLITSRSRAARIRSHAVRELNNMSAPRHG